MGERTKDFEMKFKSAAEYFKTSPDQVVSIKFRDVGNYGPFRHFFRCMESEFGHLTKPIDGRFNGRAALCLGENAIIVEHETGPEILYSFITDPIGIIGTLASLTSLALYLGDKMRHGNSRKEISIERRRINKNGELIEEKLTYSEFESQLKKVIFKPYEDKISALEEKIKTLEKRKQSKAKAKTKTTKNKKAK